MFGFYGSSLEFSMVLRVQRLGLGVLGCLGSGGLAQCHTGPPAKLLQNAKMRIT